MQPVSQLDHTEKAFLRQPTVFNARKKALGRRHGKGLRFARNVGLGIKTPTEVFTFDRALIYATATQEKYVDKKCPFTGDVSIRGRILKGVVISTKMQNTAIIRRDYLHYVPKYRRFEKRHSNLAVHVSPCFRIKEGDVVTVGQCRPLSKTVRFNVLKVDAASDANAQRSKKTFRVF